MAQAYKLNPGMSWNPLKKHRNEKCPCGSGKKSKKCCGRSHILPNEEASFVIEHFKEAKKKS